MTKPMSPDRSFQIFCVLLSIVPVIRLVSIISNTCSNVVFFDFVHVMPVINAGLSNELSLSTVLQDFSLGGHPQIASLIFHILTAKLLGLNALVEEYLCVFIMYLSTVVTFFLFIPKKGSSWRFLLLPILSFIQFSLCLSSEFFNQYSFANDAINRLVFSIGILCILRIERPSLAGIILMVCGTISSTCAAGFVVSTWVCFIFVAICLKRFEKLFLGCVMAGWLLSFIPMLVVQLGGTSRFDPGSNALAPVGRFLTSISLALMNNTSTDIPVTAISIIGGGLGLLIVVLLTVGSFYWRIFPPNIACCLSYALFGLMNLLAVSVARQYLRPWYCSFSVFFWEAIVSLSFVLLLSAKGTKAKRYSIWPAIVSISAIGFFSYFYLATNRSYADKDWFRSLHSPSAESNLRSFLWAPTYAASSFDNLIEYWQFGRNVSLHNLSCFNLHQVWLMQGDFSLPTVVTGRRYGTEGVHWLRRKGSSSPTEYTVPEHLTVSVPSGAYFSWLLDFPKGLKSATALLDVCSKESAVAGRKLVIRILSENNQVLSGPISIVPTTQSRLYRLPLTQFAGRSIKFLVDNPTPIEMRQSPILITVPRVDCRFEEDYFSLEAKNSRPIPCNVDSASDQFGVVSKIRQLKFDFNKDWSAVGFSPDNPVSRADSIFCADNDRAHITSQKRLNISPADWHEFFFEAALPENSRHGFFLCEFILNSGRVKRAIIPVIPDGKMHKYTFQLKLIESVGGESIDFFQLYPFYAEGQQFRTVRLGSLGFLQRDYNLPISLLGDPGML
ncbi:MAG: hypothetical protein IPM93_23165 [Candidatus Obscuribacter sp.]|nr:hypothetical protein [Candidatus Obscuribacter sp.]